MLNQFTLDHIIKIVNIIHVSVLSYQLHLRKISAYFLNAVWMLVALFVVAPIGCGRFVLGHCFLIWFLVPFLVQQSSYFNYAVSICVPFVRCSGSVSSL